MILKGNKLKTQAGLELYRTENVQIFSTWWFCQYLKRNNSLFFFESEPLGVRSCLLLTNQDQEKLDW